jgi:hypothetical protein
MAVGKIVYRYHQFGRLNLPDRAELAKLALVEVLGAEWFVQSGTSGSEQSGRRCADAALYLAECESFARRVECADDFLMSCSQQPGTDV